MSQLIKNNAITKDEWTLVIPPVFGDELVKKQAGKVVQFKLHGEETFTQKQIDGTVIPAAGKIILPLTVWQANKHALTARMVAKEIGIALATHEPINQLIEAFDDINSLPLIAVFVGKCADGRNFTLGNLLRTRYHYKNELRAVGDVLRDQLFFLKRSGYSSYLIRADRSAIEAIESLKDFSEPYQGAVDEKLPLWRRVNR
ncbi:MAG: DUF934 domain-containing protein [Methylophilaceae bacterium]